MFKKIEIGLALMAVVCSIAASGYALGKYLKQRELASEVPLTAQAAEQEAFTTPASN